MVQVLPLLLTLVVKESSSFTSHSRCYRRILCLFMIKESAHKDQVLEGSVHMKIEYKNHIDLTPKAKIQRKSKYEV